jgi:hypothetical protein
MSSVFQMLTGDEWSTITREMFADEEIDRAVAFFFCSYMVLAGVILINVSLSQRRG